jgi:hypothetical protein
MIQTRENQNLAPKHASKYRDQTTSHSHTHEKGAIKTIGGCTSLYKTQKGSATTQRQADPHRTYPRTNSSHSHTHSHIRFAQTPRNGPSKKGDNAVRVDDVGKKSSLPPSEKEEIKPGLHPSRLSHPRAPPR